MISHTHTLFGQSLHSSFPSNACYVCFALVRLFLLVLLLLLLLFVDPI